MKLIKCRIGRSTWACLPLLIAGIAGGSANAAIIPTLTSVLACTNCGGSASSGFAFTYAVNLDSQQIINTGSNASFGTIYDFGPMLGTIGSTGLLSTNFVISTPAFNTPAFATAPADTALTNIRYTAIAPLTVPSNMTLGTLTAYSANPQGRLVNYDGQATKASDGVTITGNVGLIGAPTVVPNVPEPTTAGLFLVGLTGALAMGRNRVSRS